MAKQNNVLGIDIGGTKISYGVVDVKSKQLVDRIKNVPTSRFETNDELLDFIECINPKKLPIGICAPGKKDGLQVDCPNISWKKLNLSGIKNINVENDLGGASYAINEDDFSLWTISTGGNGHSVINGLHTDHELGHQIYSPFGIDLPGGFEMPKCGCGGGKAGLETHLEVGFSAGGAEKMAKQYLSGLKQNSAVENPLLRMALIAHNVKSSNRKASVYEVNQLGNEAVRDEVLLSLNAGMIYGLSQILPSFDPQRFIVPIQIQSLAQMFGNYLSHYLDSVETIYIMGSQGINNFGQQVVPAVELCKKNIMHHLAIKFPEVKPLGIKNPGVIGSALAYAVKNR